MKAQKHLIKHIHSFLICLLFSHMGFAQLSGTYTIGGSSPDYATISAAALDLQSLGVAGPVTFNIRPGTYTEHIQLNTIPFASEANRVIFQSESEDSSSVTISYTASSPSNNYVWQFSGASFVTLRHLTFDASASTSYGKVITILSSQPGLIIEHCALKGIRNPSSYNGTLIYALTDAPTGFVIQHNRFLDGTYAMYLEGHPIWDPDSLQIVHNSFEHQVMGGIEVKKVDEPTIQYNTFNYDTLDNVIYCIKIEESDSGGLIADNRILWQNNGSRAIYLNTCNGATSNRWHIYNNMISMSGFVGNGTGIYVLNSAHVYAAFNSILLYDSPVGSVCIWFAGTGNSQLGANNNNLVNLENGYAIRIDDNGAIKKLDNNNVYSTGNFGYLSGAHSTLTSWRMATGRSSNSVSVFPTFHSYEDLHLCGNELEGLGSFMGLYPTDFDGEPRLGSPDIGADEYSPLVSPSLGLDVVDCPDHTFGSYTSNPLWSDGSQDPDLTVTTSGSYWVQVSDFCESLRDTVEVIIYPSLEVNLGNDTTLCGGDSIVLDAGYPGASYLWNDGGSDQNTTVNFATICIADVTVGSCSDSDTIDIQVDTVNAGYTWTDLGGGMVDFTNTSSADASMFSWSFGEGGSSSDASPNYTYGTLGSYPVCLSASSAAGCADTICDTVHALILSNQPDESIVESASVFPNPFQDELIIEWQTKTQSPLEVVIRDIHGREVYRQMISEPKEPRIRIATAAIPPGVYLLYLVSEEKQSTYKVLK